MIETDPNQLTRLHLSPIWIKEKVILDTLMSNPDTSVDDITIVTTRRVACDGGGGALGHPKTYLDMGQDTEVTCKYCDRVFKLDPNAPSGGSH